MTTEQYAGTGGARLETRFPLVKGRVVPRDNPKLAGLYIVVY